MAKRVQEPEVPISVFKVNPIAYAETGALVMVHHKPRLRVVPVIAADASAVEGVKTRLRLLNALTDQAAAEDELAELTRERDRDTQEPAL